MAQTHKKLEDQDSKICQHQQQQEKLQQKFDDIKKTHKLEVKKIKDKDSELTRTHKKLEDQDSKICQHQQQ